MNPFLNIGTGELMAILAIAILVIGPKRLVTIAQALGRIVRRMQGISSEFVGSLQAELAETEKEAREAMEGVAEEGADISAEIEGAERQAESGTVNVQKEIREFGQEAQQALKEVAESFTGIVKAEAEKPEAGEEEDEEETGEA